MSVTEDSDDEGGLSLFQEPEGWEPEAKPCTYQIYTLPEEKENITTSSNDIKLRFVGDSPLWVSGILHDRVASSWRGDMFYD